MVALVQEALLQGQFGLSKVDAGEVLAGIACCGLCHGSFSEMSWPVQAMFAVHWRAAKRYDCSRSSEQSCSHAEYLK